VERPFVATVEFTGPFKIYGSPFRIKALNRKPVVTGELVRPVAVQASSSPPDGQRINRVFDGSGLRDQDNDGLLEHSSKPADMWLTEKGQTTGWIEFDLGKVHKLDLIQIWNFNEKWHTNRGLSKADISVWMENKGWQKVLDDFGLDEADGSDDYDEPVLAKLAGVEAQKVRLDDLANLGDAEYVGLSEVRFFELLGPAAVRPQPADGTKGVSLSGLTLNWTPGSGAVAHNLYFGTEPNNLELLGRVEDAGTAKLSRLARDTTYYWRIDEVQADGSAARSKVWSFQTGGLLAWWKFDETEGGNAGDSSGNKYTGTLVGEPQWQSAGGKMGGSLQLDGKSHVEVPAFDLTTDTVTFVAWIKGWKMGNWAGIVFSRKMPDDVVACGMHFGENNTLHYTWNNNNKETWSWLGGPPIPQDEWAMVAVAIEPNKATAYVCTEPNGIQQGVNSISHVAQRLNSLKIGWDETDQSRRFKGLIDDVRIYNCALSKTDVEAFYSGKALPAVAKVTLEMPAAKVAREKPPAEVTLPGATGQEEPGTGRNWIPVLIIVVIVGVVVGFAALSSRRKPQPQGDGKKGPA
jgi:hypothetical protein